MLGRILLALCLLAIARGKVQWVEISADHAPVYTTNADAHPEPRAGAAAFCRTDNVYVTGGTTSKHDLWKYETSTGRWLWLGSGPGTKTRSYAAYATQNQEFWMYGGLDGDDAILEDFWHYSVITRQWNPQPHAGPGPRYAAVFWSDAANNRLYMYGGIGPDGTNQSTLLLQDLWHYDTQSHTWVPHPASVGPGPLAHAVATQIEDTVYLFGGQTDLSTGSVTNALWTLSLASLQWTQASVTEVWPEARQGHVLFPGPTADTLLVFGGRHNNDLKSKTLWAYDLAGQTWSQQGSGGPAARYDMAQCTDDEGTTYIMGGAHATTTVYNDVWQYGNRPTFAVLQSIFKFDLNYTNVSLSYVVAMVTLLMVFAIAFAVAACIIRCRRRRRKKNSPLQAIEEF